MREKVKQIPYKKDLSGGEEGQEGAWTNVAIS